MSYLDNARGLRMLGMTLYEGKELLDEEQKFLAIALLRVAGGEDANEVLGVKLGRGKKEKDVIARQRMSFILHMVECFMFPDPDSDEQDMKLEQACIKAEEEIVPIAKKLYPGADKTRYTAEYIQRCHSSPEYRHMRSPLRSWTDDDFPYTEQIEDPK
jgi:hypothetical protein